LHILSVSTRLQWAASHCTWIFIWLGGNFEKATFAGGPYLLIETEASLSEASLCSQH